MREIGHLSKTRNLLSLYKGSGVNGHWSASTWKINREKVVGKDGWTNWIRALAGRKWTSTNSGCFLLVRGLSAVSGLRSRSYFQIEQTINSRTIGIRKLWRTRFPPFRSILLKLSWRSTFERLFRKFFLAQSNDIYIMYIFRYFILV